MYADVRDNAAGRRAAPAVGSRPHPPPRQPGTEGPPPSAASGNPAHPAPVDDFRGPFVMGYIPISGERERKAANFALQWRPDDTSELYAEGFITDYANVFSLDFFVGLPFLGNGDISCHLQHRPIVRHGAVRASRMPTSQAPAAGAAFTCGKCIFLTRAS